ncbi:MAG TPA: hypothetical protein VLA56_11905 [Pseudomonadales bacterium]|nr:hypothetical protein [Pseudomonadales bacterium]
MPRKLPFRATTATGNAFDFEFPLHPDTADPLHVSNLLTELLHALDREIRVYGDVGNGDVLQALAMALAVRTRMLGERSARVDALVTELVETALGAEVKPSAGNQDPNAPRDLH